MHCQYVGTSVSEPWEKFLRFSDHKMDVYRNCSNSTDCSDDEWPESQIGNIVPIHNIHMDIICPTINGLFHALTQTSDVR
jgi:hypothetical protein